MTIMRSSGEVTSVKLSLVNTRTASGGGFQSGLLRCFMNSTIPSHAANWMSTKLQSHQQPCNSQIMHYKTTTSQMVQ